MLKLLLATAATLTLSACGSEPLPTPEIFEYYTFPKYGEVVVSTDKLMTLQYPSDVAADTEEVCNEVARSIYKEGKHHAARYIDTVLEWKDTNKFQILMPTNYNNGGTDILITCYEDGKYVVDLEARTH